MEPEKILFAKGKAAMILGTNQDEPLFVRDKAAAKLLGLARQTFVNLRHQGKGPRYVKATSRAVCYSVRDLLEYMQLRRVGTEDQPRE